MSHFEFVSVAVALIYALVVARLLTGLTPSLQADRRYAVQIAWIFVLLLSCVLQWWVFWRTSEVSWSPIRFLWVLILPSMLFLQAGLLVGANPETIESFRTHFAARRVPLFSLGLASAAVSAIFPWVLGLAPWLALAPFHPIAVVFALLWTAGLVFPSDRAQATIVSVTFLVVIGGFFFIPVSAA